jgi:hypothetical protein
MAKQRFLLPKPDTQLTLFAMCPLMLSGIGRNDAARHNHRCQVFCDFFCHIALVQLFATVHMNSEDQLTLDEIFEVIPSIVMMRYPAESGTAEKCLKIIRQLFGVLRHNGLEYITDVTPELLDDFYWMATRKKGFKEPTSTTAASRQWGVRSLFLILTDMGLWDGPDISGPTISREQGRTTRPMTEEEIKQIQVMTHNVLIPTGEELLLALALCGASPSEIAVVCTQDIDIDARLIQLWGESERTNQIDDWSLGVMSEAVMRIPDSTPMVVRPDLPIQRAAHTVTVRLNRLIRQAGFSSSAEFELTGVSIRLGAARKVFDSDGLEAAAIFLGNQSLDATAKALRYDWWAQN